jgi:alpha-tubulin suppressor-like RCC1 family protein
MGNAASQSFYYTSTWTAPAGVTEVNVIATNYPNAIGNLGDQNQTTSMLDSLGNLWMVGVLAGYGSGSTSAFSSPILVSGNNKFVRTLVSNQVSTDGTMMAITSQGKLFAFGDNTVGQIGDGTVVSKSSPVQVVGGLTFSYITISGQTCVMGLSPSGNVYTWGQNGLSGVGGVGNNTADFSSPVQVVGGQRFGSVTYGGQGLAAYGINTAGAMYSWGANTNGQSGDGTVANKSSPVAVLGGLTFAKFAGIQTGPTANMMAGITTSGDGYAWGINTNGILGLGDTTSRSSPVLILGGQKWQSLHVSANTMWGLTTSGIAYAWGANARGQLGDGTTTNRSSPVQVLGGLTFSRLLPVNDNSGTVVCLGLTTSGQLYAWGGNTNGELGDGTQVDKSSPVAVLGGLTFTQIYGNYEQNLGCSMFGVTPGGKIYAWGRNDQGELGLGDQVPRSSPVAVVGTFLASPVTQTQTVIPVVPGTSYTITMNQYNALFGTTIIGTNYPDLVTLSFDE